MVEYDNLFFEELEKKLLDTGVCKPLLIGVNGKSDTLVHYLRACKELEYVLLDDLEACDAKWNLFITATINYSDNQLLLPYIPDFTRNVEEMLDVINVTPSLYDVRFKFLNKDYTCNNKLVIKLLHFVLIILNEPRLEKLKYFQFVDLMANIEQSYNVDIPTYVFKVNYSINSEEEVLFEGRSMSYGTKFGFFGCNLDSLYKILCDGFKSHKKHKTSDDKIYLNNEIGIILKNMTGTPCWENSCCGKKIKVIALCEFINRHEYIKSSVDKDLKCTHIIIDLPEIVRIRFLFYYCELTVKQVDLNESLATRIFKNELAFPISCFIFLFGPLAYVYKNNIMKYLLSGNRKLKQILFHTFMYLGL
ncbi:uncharacterized protein LOC119670380 [Teleopsis dalmanni]|uniref:uncharacterized protein LOC119670380 n=1 Tax=Teleopsis dalmanni TaxID=139649 RepID=UPI0018CCCDF3|nr:uncharacterized protein LOC119670380 [Teleopsis dalmanni]XP_037936554.1 uncharacterized protein LOC119670380 [Teleopsis dalmanni]